MDCFIVCLLFIICVFIGLKKSIRVKSFQGAIKLQGIQTTNLTCSIIAAVTGAGFLLGGAEVIYAFGLTGIITVLSWNICLLTSAYVIPLFIKKFKGCLTLPDIAQTLYGERSGLFVSFLTIFWSLGSLTVQATAMSAVFSYLFGIKGIYGVIAGFSIIAIYSILGGMRAVIYAEVFKTALYLFVAPVACLIAATTSGTAIKIPFSILNTKLLSNDALLLGSTLILGSLPIIEVALVQRYLMASSNQQLKVALKASFVVVTIMAISIIAITWIVMAASPTTTGSESIFYFVNNFLPTPLKGLMIAGIIAIIMSKAESTTNATSVVLVHNMVGYFFKQLPENTKLTLLRFFTIGLLSIATLLSTQITNIIDVIFIAANFWDPIILIPILSGLLGFKASPRTLIISTICATIAVFLGYLYTLKLATISFCFGMAGSCLGFFGTHYITKLVNSETIDLKLNDDWINEKKFLLADYLKHIKEQFSKETSLKPRYNEFLIFIFASYFTYAVELVVHKFELIPALLTGFGYSLALILAFRECIFPKNKEIFLEHFWRITLILTLPCTGTAFLFSNNGNDFWIVGGIISIFALSYFVDSARFILYYIIGLIAASIICQITNSLKVPSWAIYNSVLIIFFALFVIKVREQEAKKQLETLQIFGGVMAHEVKSPLATIYLYAQTIKNNLANAVTKTNQVTLKDFATIRDLIESLVEITSNSVKTVNRLLGSYRSDISADPKIHNSIASLVVECVNDFTQHHRNIVNLKIEKDFHVFASTNNLKLIIQNLLNNTVKHGGVNVPITIKISENKLVYQDFGYGISAKHLGKIFHKYYSTNGTGMGLAFCKMVMEDIKGSIKCHSTYGCSTTFVLDFYR